MSNLHDPILPFDWLLSDELRLIKAQFGRHSGGPVQIDEAGVEAVIKQLAKALKRAKEYEAAISWMRWNARAALDREANRKLLQAINLPDSNVTLLVPNAGYTEVPFSDGRER